MIIRIIIVNNYGFMAAILELPVQQGMMRCRQIYGIAVGILIVSRWHRTRDALGVILSTSPWPLTFGKNFGHASVNRF